MAIPANKIKDIYVKGFNEYKVRDIENKIDQQLIEAQLINDNKSLTKGETVFVTVNPYIQIYEINEIEFRYKRAGWNIEFKTDRNSTGFRIWL